MSNDLEYGIKLNDTEAKKKLKGFDDLIKKTGKNTEKVNKKNQSSFKAMGDAMPDGKIKSLTGNIGAMAVKMKNLAAATGPVGVAFAATTLAIVGTTAAMYKLAGATAKMADDTGKAAQRLGVSIEFYQKLQSAAEHAGTSVSTMNTGMRTMLRMVTQVEEGNKLTTQAFEDLGVSIYDANGELRGQEELFSEVMLSLTAMTNETERNALAQKVMGRSASELAPLFNEGTDAVKAFFTENESAVKVSKDLAKSGAVWNDTVQTMGEKFKKAKNEALEPFMGIMADLIIDLEKDGLWDDMVDGAKDFFEVIGWIGGKLATLISEWNWILAGQAKSEADIKSWEKVLGVQQDMNDEVAQYHKKIKEIDKLETDGLVSKEKAEEGRKNYQEYITRKLEEGADKLTEEYKLIGTTNTSLKYKNALLKQIGVVIETNLSTSGKTLSTAKEIADAEKKRLDAAKEAAKLYKQANVDWTSAASKLGSAYEDIDKRMRNLSVEAMTDGLAKDLAKLGLEQIDALRDTEDGILNIVAAINARAIAEKNLIDEQVKNGDRTKEDGDIAKGITTVHAATAVGTAFDYQYDMIKTQETIYAKQQQDLRDQYAALDDIGTEANVDGGWLGKLFGVSEEGAAIADQYISAFQGMATNVMGIINEMVDYSVAKDKKELDSWKKTQKEKSTSFISSARVREDEERRIAKETEKREEEIAKKQRKMQVVNTITQGLSGAAMAFAQAAGSIPPPAGPIIGGINAGLVMGMATVNAARIASFSDGGIFGGAFNGAQPGKDNMIATVRKDELAINSSQQKNLWGWLSGSKDMPSGSTVNLNIESYTGSDDELSKLEDMLYSLQSANRFTFGVS